MSALIVMDYLYSQMDRDFVKIELFSSPVQSLLIVFFFAKENNTSMCNVHGLLCIVMKIVFIN